MAEENTVTTTENGTGAETQDTRTFTQAELNAIVQDRLSRERGKYADYDTLKEKASKWDAAEEEGKTELQKAQDQAAALQKQVDAYKKSESLRTIREKVSQETGVPADLLWGETEDACKAQAAKFDATVFCSTDVPGSTCLALMERDGEPVNSEAFYMIQKSPKSSF